MAILKNLIVNGSSRFLNTAYFQDVSIAGSAALASLSLSGTLSVTGAATFGNITATGTVVFSKTQDLSGTANNSPALIVGGTATSAHMEFDCNEIHAKATGTTVADLYLNSQGGKVYLSGSSVYASGSSLVAATGNIATLNATNVNVTNNLRANHYDLQTVAQLGGSFYVSPTVKFPNSGTTLKVEKSGSTLTLTITDSSITSATMAGVVWTAGSGVKVSGTINGVVTGTMDGTVSSINTSSHVLTLSVSGENSSNVVAGTYTASQFINLTVMLYTRKQDGTNKMINTASGSIASFTDGGNKVPVKQLVVDIEPVQDLHGYDAPWVGGAGKNKFKMRSVSQSSNGITVTANSDGTVSFSGTATANAQITMYDNADILTSLIAEGGTFTMSLNKGTYNANTLNVSIAYKETANGSMKFIIPNNPVTIPQGSIFNNSNLWVPSGSTVQTLDHFAIQFEKGSSATTFAPYSNICPISGHDTMKVTRTGKNLLVPYVYTITDSGVQFDYKANGDIVLNGKSTGATSVPISSRVTVRTLLKAGTYTPSVYGDNVGIQIVAYNPVERISEGGTFTLAHDREVFARLSVSANQTYNNAIVHMQVEEGLTATEYEPYNGQTVTIDLGGTRYGGNLDVGTGVLTVDRAMVDLGTLSWFADTNNYGVFAAKVSGKQNGLEGMCSSYPVETRHILVAQMLDKSLKGNDNNPYINIKDSSYAGQTGATFKTIMNGVQFVYPLAEPFTVQLTANKISTLLGQNNIWADTGDTNVIYESSQVDSTNNYNVGIWMNCYDQANSSSTIRVYNGSSRWPNVFLGNMTNADLPRVNGNAPYGYGLYSDNVFLRGIISANGGLIGNWTIGTTGMYYNSDAPGSTSITMIPGGTAASTTSIGGSSGSKQWIFTGKNLFGIDTDGKLYASSAYISGTLVAGANSKIGPWTVTATSIYKGANTLGSTTSGAAYFGDLGLSVGNKFKVDASGVAILGESSGYHATMDTDSFDVLNGSTILATFGKTATIGNMSARGISIDSNGFKFNNEGNTNFYIGVDLRAGQMEHLSNYYNISTSSTSQQIGGKKYYLLTSVPSDATVMEVGNSLTLGGEATGYRYKDWVVNQNKLWLSSEEVDSFGQDTVAYIYTQPTTNISAPYCVIGKSFYTDSKVAGNMSFAQGYGCLATGAYSTAIGWQTIASGMNSFACGLSNEASGRASHAEGQNTTASGEGSHAEGSNTTASEQYSHAEGGNTTASGRYSHAEGGYTIASQFWSHAEGENTTASGFYSHAEGYSTTASNQASHAEGNRTTASALYSHAEGTQTTASNSGSHAEGDQTTASGSFSHAEGSNTTASGWNSHAEGHNTIAAGEDSHAGGLNTVALHNQQFVIGKYNKATVSGSGTDSDPYTYADTDEFPFIIGNGSSNNSRSNAFTVDWSGNVWAAGSVQVTGKVMAANTSYIGMIIISTTLNTMAKVIAIYGGTYWIQHLDYMLYAAITNVVANSAVKTGGEATHKLTINEMPSHRHKVSSGWQDAYGTDRIVYSAKDGGYNDYGLNAVNFIENTGGGAAHNNMPPYKNVYIWERTK